MAKIALLLMAFALAGCEIVQSMRDSVATPDPGGDTYEDILAWFDGNEVAPFPEGAAVAEDAPECSGANEAPAISPFVLWPEPLIEALRTTGTKPWALVGFDVTQTGRSENIRMMASSAPPPFERTALESVANWEFQPAPSGKRASGCVAVFR
jgi:TonB family protein